MATPLPDPNSLRSGLLTLLGTLSTFESSRRALEFSAASGDGAISTKVDGTGFVLSLTIAPSQLGLSAQPLASKVKGVVNSAIDAANNSTASAVTTFASTLSLPGLPAHSAAPPGFADFSSIVDTITAQIIANNPCQSTRLFECRKGAVLAVVTAGRRIATLTIDEPLPSFVGYLEQQIIRALNCAIDEGTKRDDETPDTVIGTVGSPSLQQLVLYAKGLLKLNDRAKIKTASCADWARVANAGSTETNVGVETDVGSIVSRAKVVVRDRGRVHGSIRSGNVLEKHELTEIDGPVDEHASIVLPELALNVVFPTTTQGTIEPEPDQQRTAAPAYYQKLAPKPRSQVFLSSGVYYFNDLAIEPDAKVWLNASAGPIIIWVKSSFTFRGAFLDPGGAFPRVFVGYLGTSLAVVESVYKGTLSAPNAKINIATLAKATYEGAFHGKDIEVFPDALICHHPFELRYEELPGLTPPGGFPPPVVDLGFETIAGWSSSQAALTSSANPIIQGARSLQISNATGATEIVSATFSANLAPTGVTRLLVELWVPSNQPNPTLFGNFSVVISIPSAGINQVNLGSQGLTGRPLNQFSGFEFPLPTAVRQALDGQHDDVSLKLVLNINSGSGPWFVDNVRFLLPAPATPQPPASLNPILSFEDGTKWSSPQVALTTSTAQKTHLQRALQVPVGAGSTQVVSVPFSSAELSAPQGRFKLDLRVPSIASNPASYGRFQLRVDVPSAGIQDAATALVELTPLPKNVFNTLDVVLPTKVKDALDGTHTDVRLKLVFSNVPSGSGPYYLDNIRFI